MEPPHSIEEATIVHPTLRKDISPIFEKSMLYREYVAEQASLNPALLNLKNFLQTAAVRQRCRITALDFSPNNVGPATRAIGNEYELEYEFLGTQDSASDLSEYQQDMDVFDHDDFDKVETPTKDSEDGFETKTSGRILIVEDPTHDTIATLGSRLDIDPLFFSSHINAPWVETSEQDTDISTLPSRLRPQKYINIHSQRTFSFHSEEPPPKKLLRKSNIARKVSVLPPLKDAQVALVQSCISVYKAKSDSRGWLGIILVDAPMSNECYVTNSRGEELPVELSLNPFGGGFGDFLDSSSNSYVGDRDHKLYKKDPFDSLIYYFSRRNLLGASRTSPSVLSLAEYPLRIVASEWMIYYQVMRYSIKQYEYAPGGSHHLLLELEKLNRDLRGLQTWRRRALSSSHKINAVTRFLYAHKKQSKKSPGEMELCESLAEDFDYVTSSIETCSRLLQGMLPVVTSFVQIVDSRRSVQETANISRLTILALVFVPLTFVSSIFSMNSDYGPGGPEFYWYFVVALPITLLVYLVALPPRVVRRALSTAFAPVKAQVVRLRARYTLRPRKKDARVLSRLETKRGDNSVAP